MLIGEVLKQTRKKLGLSQKEMAGNILSYSYYSKVERGLYDINVTDLIDILNHHQIDIDDFFKKLNIDSSKKYRKVFIRKLKQAFYHFDQNSISGLRQEILTSKYLNRSDQKYLLDISMEMLAVCCNNLSLIDAETRIELKNMIFDFQIWDEEALEVFVMAMLVFDETELNELIDIVYRKFSPISKCLPNIQELLACIPVNYFHICILRGNKDYSTMKKCESILDHLSEIEILGTYKIEARYLLALLNKDSQAQISILSGLKFCKMNSLIGRLHSINCQL